MHLVREVESKLLVNTKYSSDAQPFCLILLPLRFERSSTVMRFLLGQEAYLSNLIDFVFIYQEAISAVFVQFLANKRHEEDPFKILSTLLLTYFYLLTYGTYLLTLSLITSLGNDSNSIQHHTLKFKVMGVAILYLKSLLRSDWACKV